jgi:hypothetical protein
MLFLGLFLGVTVRMMTEMSDTSVYALIISTLHAVYTVLKS